MINLRLKLNKNKKKRILAALALLLISLLLVLIKCSAINFNFFQPSRLEVDFFDIGQGDSALIKTPSGKVILIDGGPDNKVLRRLGKNLPFYRRRIDFVIFSHYHDDHITGLIEVLKRYRVKNLVFAPTEYSSPILQVFLKTADEEKIASRKITSAVRLDFGDNCFLNLLNPEFLGIPKDENNSLCARLDCAGQTFLFTGDNSYKAEKAVIASGWDLAASILKAAHHGSNSANSEVFLRAVNPQLLIISVGADNKFGHPSPQVLERAADLGIDIKRTDESETVRILGP